MIQIKKTILTLVALLAVTAQAWADGIVCTASDLGKVLCTDGSIYENVSAATTAGKTAAAVIAYVDETNKNGLAIALSDEGEMDWSAAKSTCEGKTAVSGVAWLLPSVEQWRAMFFAFGGNDRSYTGLNTAITTAGGTALQGDAYYWSSTDLGGEYVYSVYLVGGSGGADLYEDRKSGSSQVRACLAFDIADAPSGTAVTVDWNKAEKTGTFTMPGGNVELEPEYYPQAALTAQPTAINDVPATTDGAIVKAGTVANIGGTTTAQGTVMYYVSPTALDDAALLALAADAWTADVPTAESFTAAGTAYVYYYVRGNDSDTDEEIFSDGDILSANALTVTIAAAPTYAVTFAEGVNPEPPAEPEWTASPNANVTKGQTVTVTYSGTKKVLGVKAEKKAPVTYPMVSEATAADYGKVVCAAGHLHDAKTAVPSGCTAVGILGKVTETGHGLILALQNATSRTWNTINGWESVTTYAGTTLKLLPDNDARGSLTSYTALGSTTVSDWAVAQKSDYEAIFINLGSTNSDEDGTTYDGNVNAYITTGVGGTAISGTSWSATAYNGTSAWNFAQYYWNNLNKTNSYSVRPVLAF